MDDPDEYLLCLNHDEDCDQTAHHMEVTMGTMKLSIVKAIVAVFIAAPAQFLFELFCVYLIKYKHN